MFYNIYTMKKGSDYMKNENKKLEEKELISNAQILQRLQNAENQLLKHDEQFDKIFKELQRKRNNNLK